VHGQAVVTSDDQKLGHVVAVEDDIAILENGHLRKHRHALPTSLLHDAEDGLLRATVGKPVVESSPRVDGESFDRDAVLTHYGLIGPTVVDPDPDGLDSAETAGAREGVEPAPAERLGTLGGEGDPAVEQPAVFDRMPSGVNDPSGSTANYH
jgi:hypothetical protein